MTGATATPEKDLDELEEEFVKNFAIYLMKISNVSDDFGPGGQTTAAPGAFQKAGKAVPNAVGALVPYGKAVVKPLEEAFLKVFNKLDRKDRKKIYRVLPQKKNDARKMFVDAAVKIFRMFEYQFSSVVAEEGDDGRRAMAKLAEDAAERVINYVIEEYENIIKIEFHKSRDFVFNAVLFGDLKWKIIRKGRTLLFNDSDSGKQRKINTTDLFENSGYILNENGKIILKKLEKGICAETCGYRQLWPFDEYYKKGKWETVENISMQYEYKLPFDEESVANRVQEIIEKLTRRESCMKEDVEELCKKMEEGYLKVVEEIQKGHKSMEVKGDDNEDFVSRRNSFHLENMENIPKLSKKWWPEKKLLIKSLLQRKSEKKLLIEELRDRILKDENRMVVICESLAASKYSGMGGVGKTLTAKWYAHTYGQEYDHIIWIDCGEGSLLTSFESLARDLDIPNRNELVNVENYSRKCCDALSGFKCLWIYDNAENYNGEEGIINVLPIDEKEFHCIITSRSREWGTETAFGKISDLELDIFSDEESVEFLKFNLNTSTKHTESQLKELSRLMGNLPLALQLAVAALNNRKIELQRYIEKTSSKDLGFLDEKFDDYEKTINKNIRISMDLILQERSGKLAYEMLMIFGYIRPDDIRSLFLMKILNIEPKEMEEVIHLLEKYSLVTKSGRIAEFPYDDGFLNKLLNKNKIKIDMDVLSIHRLLQQVIRHNGRKTENETLKKILGCAGFIDYKFIPYTKYANEEMQKEFSKVKAELVNQQQLSKLIYEKRFEESVQLAKYIHEEMKTKTTKFNLAVCLAKNEQLENSVDVLKELEKEEIKETTSYSKNLLKMGILSLKDELSRDLIWGQLLIIYWKLDNSRNIKELLESRNKFKIIHSTDSLNTLIRLIHSEHIKTNYSLVKGYCSSTIEFQLGGESSKIVLRGCSLEPSSFDRLSPAELKLANVSFNRNRKKEEEEANVNKFCDLEKINQLSLEGDGMSIELSDEISMECLFLYGVKVLNWKEANWNIQKLELAYIPFMEKSKLKIKEMDFKYSSLDVSCLPPTIEILHLNEAKVLCNTPIEFPKLKYLTLGVMSDSHFLSSFRSSNPTHIHFNRIKEVNIEQLPESVTHIKITNNKETIIVGGVKRVDKLILQDFYFTQVKQLLGYFTPDDLVVQSNSCSPFTPKELIELTNTEINRFAVGRIKWDQDHSILSNQVDRNADFYSWEAGRWKGMKTGVFRELFKLY